MAKVITKEDVAAACEKAADKATAAETKRCVAAVKEVEAGKDVTSKEFKQAAVASIKGE